MSWIDELPEPQHFGEFFDYSQWDTRYSSITLFRVPWSSDYRDIAYFPTHALLQEYLDTRDSLPYAGFTELKLNQPIKVSIPVNVAMEYNYIRVFNPQAPTGAGVPDHFRYLYYFINDVISEATNTTRLVLQLDVVQTYLREVNFGQAYVEQGHVGIAESNVTVAKQGLLSQPEGMDLGTDYVVMDEKRHEIAHNANGFKVIMVSTIDLEKDAGTLTKPNRDSATGSDWEGLPNGAALYVFDSPRKFTDYVASMSATPWGLEGVISVTAVPQDIFASDATLPTVLINGHSVIKPTSASVLKVSKVSMFPNFKNELLGNVEQRYRHLKKFSAYPYCFMELGIYSGEPLILKPEMWNDDNATIVIKSHLAPPSQRIGVRPYNYNAAIRVEPLPGEDPDISDRGEVWNVALWLANFPQFTIVNNGYLTTMAAQAHSIAAGYKDLGWQQSKALTGNTLGYDQATSGMNLANDMTQNSVNTMQSQAMLSNTTTGLQALTGAVTGIAGGAASGGGAGAAMGALGAVGGAANAAIQMRQTTESSALSQRLVQSQNAAQVGNQGFVRDTNKNYADYAAKGDYQNGANVMNAKVNDAKMSQPTTAGTSGGDAFMLAIDGWVVRLRTKMIPRSARITTGDYWLRYGYAINRFLSMPPNFQCCEVFTYWKLKETYIISARCPEPAKQALRGIFEKGVTVWHEPSMMGSLPAMMVNTPIMGNYIPYE